MEWIWILINRCSAVFHRSELDADLDEEVHSHLEFAVEDNCRRGMTPEEARRTALVQFGGLTQIKEKYRSQREFPFLENVRRDIAFTIRQLRKAPIFTLTAVVTLSIGIGAVSAVYSVLNAVLIQPLPFPSPDQLAQVRSIRDGQLGNVSALDVRDFAARNTTFAKLAVWNTWPKNVRATAATEVPEQLEVGLASRDFFDVLGLHPIAGRLFTATENEVGHNHVALITLGFCRSHYPSASDALGKPLTINGEQYSIVGVLPDTLPAWFRGVSIRIWEPFLPFPRIWEERSRGAREYGAVGRLLPNVSIEQAQSDLSTIAAGLSRHYPIDRNFDVKVLPLAELRSSTLKPSLLLLLGAVTLILLIACSNLAALLLARNSSRQQEFSMRIALGATRFTLIRQVLTETFLLSMVGLLGGMLFAFLMIIALRHNHPESIPQLTEVSLDWHVFVFTLLVALTTTFLFGLAPAGFSARTNAGESLRGAGASRRGRNILRQILVVGQIAFTLMLLVGAGLLIESIFRLQSQQIGFRAAHLVRAQFYLPEDQYGSPAAITRFCEQYAKSVRALHGVRDATITTVYPPIVDWTMLFSIAGHDVTKIDDLSSTRFGVTDDSFLRTLDIPLVKGRDFSPTDNETSDRVAIINEEFVRRYFPNGDPVGAILELGIPKELQIPDRWLGYKHVQVRIVGVMHNWKNRGLAGPVEPQLLTLYKQSPLNFGFKSILVRTDDDPDTLISSLAQKMLILDPQVPLYQTGAVSMYVAGQTSERNFIAILLTLFAMTGALLAMIGVYGVVCCLIAQRQREFGIRLALGASRAAVLWLVLRRGMFLAVMGIVIGIVGVAFASRPLSRLLYQISAIDFLTLITGSAFILTIALAASALAARRTTKIEPVEALRAE